MDAVLSLPTTQTHEDSPHNFSILARILSDKRANHKTFKATIQAAWRTKDPFTISHIETNSFSCQFHDEDELSRVINNSPWSFRGALIVLQRWPNDKAYDEVDFNQTNFWIQAHNLPLDRMNTQNAETIGKLAGRFLYNDITACGSKQRKYL